MLNKCGIYKITNMINNKAYIGCSSNINKRWNSHKQRYNDSTNKEYEKELYVAMRQYGLDNFKIEVIEECKEEDLFKRESYYIETLNTIAEGYNGYGLEKHHNSKLTILEVEDIRTRYNNLERKQDVYDDYSHIINKTGFHKIWNGYTWKSVMPEIYTKENKEFHKNNTANRGEKNGTSAIKDEDVIDIRTKKKKGEKKSTVYENYKDKLTLKSFENIWYNCNWKHIVV